MTQAYHQAHFAVDKIALLVLTLLTVLHDALSFPQVQPVTSLHSKPGTAKF